MHIAMLVIGGLAALAMFWFGARLAGWPPATGAKVFIAAWFIAAILNGAVGVRMAGIPLANEAAAFLLIFGIPAAAAWILAYRVGR